eukprot:scaffold131325_cov14-Prasinocladus_malaysianus.AAC.1
MLNSLPGGAHLASGNPVRYKYKYVIIGASCNASRESVVWPTSAYWLFNHEACVQACHSVLNTLGLAADGNMAQLTRLHLARRAHEN